MGGRGHNQIFGRTVSADFRIGEKPRTEFSWPGGVYWARFASEWAVVTRLGGEGVCRMAPTGTGQTSVVSRLLGAYH